MEMSIKFSRPNPNSSLLATSATVILILSAAGIRSNTVVATNIHGIVIYSSASNIDVGEYVQCPGFAAVATDYDLNLTHNNSSVDYTNPADQGTIYVIYFTEN